MDVDSACLFAPGRVYERMLRNRYVIGLGIIFVLFVANIISYFFSGWGLITVNVTNAPVGQIIKSIERQGWVTVSLHVDKVPLAEAMESLTANAGGQWKLAFFAAPNEAGVKQEIRAFQTDATDDGDTKTYSYRTSLDMLATDETSMPAADPRLQSWAGVQPPPPEVIPVAATGTDPQNAAPDAPPPPPTTLQDYLQIFAQQADCWIMAPQSWSPTVSAPAPSSSLIHSIKGLVNNAHGSVEQALVLVAPRPRDPNAPRRGGGGLGGDTGWAYMEDRVRSAINGLPADARPAALDQLKQEIQFRAQVQAAPPDQRRNMMMQNRTKHAGGNFWRMSPEKRAQMYQRVISNRQSARG